MVCVAEGLLAAAVLVTAMCARGMTRSTFLRGVQAAKTAGNAKLHATLVNNLGTSLVKQSKTGQALTVYNRHLDEMMSAHPITSNDVVLARHSVIDFLTSHKQWSQCTSILEDQASMLQAHYMQTLAEYKQQNRGADGASAKSGGLTDVNGCVGVAKAATSADGKVVAGDVALALQALARCHLDYGKHYDVLKDRTNAIAQGRKALAHYYEARKYREDTNPVYLSFLASQLKSKAEAAKAAGGTGHVKLTKESRQLYRDLLEAVEASGKHRNIQQLHVIVANLSIDIGDTETVRSPHE